jgi:GNAT superfamily N-acetyltransferase
MFAKPTAIHPTPVTPGHFTCAIRPAIKQLTAKERALFDSINEWDNLLDQSTMTPEDRNRFHQIEAFWRVKYPLLVGNAGWEERSLIAHRYMGVIDGNYFPDEIRLHQLWVSPASRQSGYAGRLLSHVTRVADRQRVDITGEAYPFELGSNPWPEDRLKLFKTPEEYRDRMQRLVHYRKRFAKL